MNTLKSLPSKILSVGQNLVTGLWNGIADKGKWILDKIKGFGSSILKGIKSIFGIHSPSTETAWIGEMLARGLWKGLDDSENMLDDKAAEITQGILDKMSGLTNIDAGINGMAAMSSASSAFGSGDPTDQRFDELISRINDLTAIVKANGAKQVYIDKRKLVGAIADDMDDAIGEIANRKAVGAV